MNEKYGFVYIWFDRKHKRYYVGCRWGRVDDGYVCSSPWMKRSFGSRPKDFKRRILRTNIASRRETFEEEQRWLNLIKLEEIKPHNEQPRYYNLNIINNKLWHSYDENIKRIGQKISASKIGKKLGPMSEQRKQNISDAKKKKFAERGGMSADHKEKIRQAKIGTKRSKEAKARTSATLSEKWNTDWRDRRSLPKEKMPRLEQDALSSAQLKSRWADPVWADSQRQKLKESWARRKLINNS